MNIGKDFGLLLDQNNDLVTETFMILIGLESEADYIKNIEQELGIKNDIAEKLAGRINDEVFQKILKSVRDNEDKDATLENETTVKPEEVISAIENPSSVKTPINMIDHLLTTPVTIPKETTVAPSTVQDQKPVQVPIQQKNYAVDPYREQAQ
jgi:hypothetical protein